MMILKKLDKFMEETLFYQDLPGLAIGVAIGEDSDNPHRGMDVQKVVGYKDYITKEPMQPSDVFHMASVTKLFVGTAIMQLVQASKIRLEDKVVELLPWFKVKDLRYTQITVRDLMTHTAGLMDVLDYGWDIPEKDPCALRRYVESEEVTETSLLWNPGEGKFKYSNIGYEVLGLLIAKASGMPFEDYVQQNIFDPLGMKDSTLLTFERAGGSLKLEDLCKAGMAMPHMKDEHNHIVHEPYYPYNRAHGPSSTLTTNLSDMKIWAQAHLNKTLFSSQVYEEIWKPYALVPNNGEHIGLSWFIREQNGYTLYGHEGNDNGFRASFWICPELDLHVVVASNMAKAPVKKINKSVFDILTIHL